MSDEETENKQNKGQELSLLDAFDTEHRKLETNSPNAKIKHEFYCRDEMDRRKQYFPKQPTGSKRPYQGKRIYYVIYTSEYENKNPKRTFLFKK